MKKSIVLAAFLFLSLGIFAQTELIVQKNDKGSYVTHKVVAKETFYSIGRLYNLPPKDIASFNALDMNKGLAVGQTIQIPLGESNYSQSADKGRPVYYVVGQKEGLFGVSQHNNNVLMANLRKWNRLADDKLTPGKKLIVGYLHPAESVPAATASEQVVAAPQKETPVKKNETAKEETVIRNNPETIKRDDPPHTEPVKPTQAAVTNGKGGYFRSQFEAQVKSTPAKHDQAAATGIFKTASGWQDEKYYALLDGVEPGTIVKITNPTNSKAVYAKVLGEMSGIRQNQGYDLRVSNAAASALEITDTEKFVVRVNY